MSVINAESKHPERDDEIYRAIEAGGKTRDVAAAHRLTMRNVQRIAARARKTKCFELTITDGHQSVSIGVIATSKGFEHACRFAMTKFSGTFNRLELPQWRFIAEGHQATLREIQELM